jgi:diguanylate cyclase (GGDEF)-like protein/PAS domain S-box-containing protein
MRAVSLPAARWSLGLPGDHGRTEALYALARASVLLFSGAALAFDDVARPGGLVAAHLVVAVLSVLSVVPLSRLRSAAAARRAAVWATAGDVLAVGAYAVVVDGRPGLGTLYLVYVCLMGPLRWGLPGVVATGVPTGVVATLWPMPDASGAAAEGLQLWLLILLITLPVAGLSSVWRRSGARLKQAHDQFEAAFEHASIGMALLDAQRHVLQANPSLAGLLGTPVETLAGTDLARWVEPDDRQELDDALGRLAGASHGIRLEVRFCRADGQQRWGLVAASWLAGSSGVPPRIIAQVENVTDRKSVEARLSHLAQHDVLTGLPNRSLLLAHLEDALRGDAGVCVVFLDLDRFKVVNDGLGHAAGDRLLQEVGNRLRSVMRPGDVVARIGGDEFVVLCHGVRREDEAAAVAERVLSGLRAPVRLDARSEVVASASAGVAVAGPGATPDTLLRDADTAMYSAKSAGGGRARLFTPELHQAAKRMHELEVDLRRALVEERLDVCYQPIVDLTTGRVVELETLLRWHDDVRGPVSPDDFVPVAEQSSLIDDLGVWVLDRALRDAAGWPAGRHGHAPGVAVNVSPRQLLDPAFPATVADLLAEHGFDPGRLCLEVTETALVGDTRELVPALQALRAVGVRLAIDDFGTGHASLTYLAQLPVDVVKVDRSFVAGVADEAGSAAIVGGVVAMAGAFGLTVVAEGVEQTQQLQRLRRLGVDRVQGFLLARPMRAAAVHGVLAAGAAEAVPAPRPAPTSATSASEMETPRRFRVLLDSAREITGCVDLASVLTTSFEALRRLVDFTGGSIQLVDGDVVRLAATDPPATPEAMSATMPVGTGISGGIAATGEPRYLPDITIAAAVSSTSRTKSTSVGVRSWYGVPLVAEGRVIGVLQIDSLEVDAFSDADRLLVLSFASVVASAVQTARLFAQELDALQRPPV